MVGSAIRRYGFWILDAFENGCTRKHYKDIKLINNREDNRDLIENQLSSLLNHAITTTEYYSKYKKHDSINDFPVMNKNIIKENQHKIKSRKYKDSKLHLMSTSGSTGTPFIIEQDTNKRKRTISDLIYFNEIAGQKLGDRYMYIKAFPEPKSKKECFKQNVVPVDILKLDENILEKIRLKLKKDKCIKSVLAYSSSYDLLADYMYNLKDNPKMFNIKALFSSSAVLTEDTKDKLTKVFGCPIIDRYSNQENGVLAQTRDTYGDFYVNKASYYIELLKLNSNELTRKGELGRIVVTDLYNFAVPMIRYDTGDLAISDDKERKYITTLRNIEGRRVDIIFDTKGNILTPHTWSVNMRKYDKLVQWQFIQEDKKEYVLKVNGGKGIYLKEDFKDTLRSILGNDANIDIQFVNEIPVLASGKFKNTICNYKP